jgi:hypothetical protein
VFGSARFLALGALLAASTLSPVVGAQDSPAAARAFKAGSQAYARGEFHAAAAAFDNAYDLAPRGAAAYNGGLAWEAAGDAPRAANDYSRSLRSSDLGSVERADAMGRLKGLEATVGRLTILAPDGARVTVDGAEVSEAWTGIHVTPGRHIASVRTPDGKQETRNVTVGAGEVVEVRLAQRTEPPPAPPVETTQPPATATTSPATTPRLPPATEQPGHTEPTHGADYTLPIVAVGAAVASSALAVAFYEVGLSARNDLLNDPSNQQLHDKAETFRTLTWVSWGVAAACAGAAVYLYLTTPKPAAPQATLQLGPGRLTLHVGF